MVQALVEESDEEIKLAPLKTIRESDLPERLGDPDGDRVMTNVLAPFIRDADPDKIFPNRRAPTEPDWEYMIELYKYEGKIAKAQAMILLDESIKLLKREPNYVRISKPSATVIGDIHG